MPPLELRFSIGSLMLLTALAAVICALWTVAPGLAWLLAALSLPAVLRTWQLAAVWEQRQRPMGVARKAAAFVVSLLIVLYIAIAALNTGLGVALLAIGLAGLISALEFLGKLTMVLNVMIFAGSIVLVPLSAVLVARMLYRGLWPVHR